MKSHMMFLAVLIIFVSSSVVSSRPGPAQEPEFLRTLKALRDPRVNQGTNQQGDYTGTHFADDGLALSYRPVLQVESVNLEWDGTLVLNPYWQQLDSLPPLGPDIRLRVRTKIQQISGIGLRTIGELFNFKTG